MIFRISQRPGTGALALMLFDGGSLNDDPLWKRLSAANKKLLTTLVRRTRVSGALYSVFRVDVPGTSPDVIYVLGLGKKKAYQHRRMLRAFGTLVKTARDQGISELSLSPELLLLEMWDAEQNMGALSAMAELSNYAFTAYKKTAKAEKKNVSKITYILPQRVQAAARRGVQQGGIVGAAANMVRTLSNTPGGIMTPKYFVSSVRKELEGLPVKCTVLGEAEMKKLGMGGILGVSSGSSEEAQLLITEYLPEKNGKPLVFVGKGITFDSGGINLKPEQGITDMHHDMAGAAAVIGAVHALAKMKFPRNVIGITPLAENMPGSASYRPGDLLKTMSGKVIEVGNTDAEGRVVLSDALTYAKRYAPALVVDVATLTGAAMVAVGKRLIAGFSPNEALALHLREFSERSGDYVWPLPLWEEFSEDIRGTFGDVNNSGRARSWGGASTAAAFLKEFAEGYEWIHLDTAPMMVASEGMPLAPGATGSGVRFLVDVARRFEELEPYLNKRT